MRQRLAIMHGSPMTRLGLVSMSVALSPGAEVVCNVESMRALLASVSVHHVDMIITDISGKGEGPLSGYNELFNLKKSQPGLFIILLTACENYFILNRLVEAKNIAIIAIDEPSATLEILLTRALVGEEVLSPRILELLNRLPQPMNRLKDILTHKERMILDYILQGYSVSKIAKLVVKSVKTVSAQKLSLMSKLGVSSEVELFAKTSIHRMN
ncbi:LuxR C-terminal-related transcriptional regulator [Rouxiella sp. Mn2063]|uniref:LuxR C-terminal-related transcriptional regulator n=1 Tax=Rouxiella sp. Mn2063 TaxID=3395262 RepID=UPI003BD10A24